MTKRITQSAVLSAALLATLFIFTCGKDGDNDIEVSVAITEISRIDSDFAYATVRYSAANAKIVEVGVMYGTTLGRLNVGAFDSHTGANTPEFGIVSGIPSVSGIFGADLAGLMHSTTYYVVPYIKLDKATGEFYKGYFVPTGGHRTFLTLVDDNSEIYPPEVSGCTASEIFFATARLSASVISAGRPGFTDRGFCYGTEQNPERGGNNSLCVRAPGTEIAFSEQISDLNENTTYYARAYIVNESFGIRYGAETSFKTMNTEIITFTDERDGRVYRAVEIGGVVWMAENLNCAVERGLYHGQYYCYEDYNLNCEEYGKLYNWLTAMEACPPGWRLPRVVDWNDLIEVVGGSGAAVEKLKSRTGWDDLGDGRSGNGTDDFGFSAIPGGYHCAGSSCAGFSGVGTSSYWWTATSCIVMGSGISESSCNGSNALSVRCIQGNTTYTLALNANPVAGGTVSRSPNQTNYNAGASILIEATPASGYTFTGWTGSEIDHANSMRIHTYINSDMVLTANFRPITPPQSGILTDPRDGQSYRTVKIDDLTWMAENLNIAISGSRCYENDDSKCEEYGRLYDWDAAMVACPPGWRLAADEDWINLIMAIAGDFDIAGTRLKSTTGWDYGLQGVNANGTDDIGFSALPGGFYAFTLDRSFHWAGYSGYWWSTREGYHTWTMNSRSDYVSTDLMGSRSVGLSVRCVMD